MDIKFVDRRSKTFDWTLRKRVLSVMKTIFVYHYTPEMDSVVMDATNDYFSDLDFLFHFIKDIKGLKNVKVNVLS